MSDKNGGDKPPDQVQPPVKAPWGPACLRGGPITGGPTYSSIASINTSVGDRKNILEVRLEKQEEAKFNLTILETENLLKRLKNDIRVTGHKGD